MRDMNTRVVSAPAFSFEQPGAYRIGGISAVFLHACAAVAMVLLAQVPAVVVPSAPVMVSLIAAAEPEPVPQPQEPPKPRPPRTQPLPPLPQPLLASAQQAETPATAPAPQAPPPPAAVTTPMESAPVAVVPPRFDAAYLDNPVPRYPPLARRLGEQGKVLLRVLVNADGSAAQVELKSGSGSPRLDQSALDTVERWRFIPAKLGTQAVAAWVQVPIIFTLGG